MCPMLLTRASSVPLLLTPGATIVLVGLYSSRSRLFFCSFQCIILEGKLALKTNPKPPCLSTAGDCYWPQLLLLCLITSIWACSIPLPVTPTCNTYTFLSGKNNILKSIRLPHRLPISPYYNYNESFTSEANYTLFCPISFFPNGQ